MPTDFFEELYEEHKNYIYGFVLRLTRNDGFAAEELTQDTFYNAYLSIA